MSSVNEPRSRDQRAWAPLAALALLTTACHIEPLGSSLDIAGGGLTGISIAGDSVIFVGDTVRFRASGSVGGLLGMFTYDPLDDARWSTANAEAATVTPRQSHGGEQPMARAMVRGIAPGRTVITVSARGFSASLPVRVVTSL